MESINPQHLAKDDDNYVDNNTFDLHENDGFNNIPCGILDNNFHPAHNSRITPVIHEQIPDNTRVPPNSFLFWSNNAGFTRGGYHVPAKSPSRMIVEESKTALRQKSPSTNGETARTYYTTRNTAPSRPARNFIHKAGCAKDLPIRRKKRNPIVSHTHSSTSTIKPGPSTLSTTYPPTLPHPKYIHIRRHISLAETHGMDKAAKVGIAVGIGLALIFVLTSLLYWVRRRPPRRVGDGRLAAMGDEEANQDQQATQANRDTDMGLPISSVSVEKEEGARIHGTPQLGREDEVEIAAPLSSHPVHPLPDSPGVEGDSHSPGLEPETPDRFQANHFTSRLSAVTEVSERDAAERRKSTLGLGMRELE
jgi:hypothetical protein